MSESSSESSGREPPPVLLIAEDPDNSIMLAHDASAHRHAHPERPDRLRAIWRALDALPPAMTRRIAPKPAAREHLALVHTPEHIDPILAHRGRSFIIDEDTAGNPQSIDAALLAAGSAVALVDALLASSPGPSASSLLPRSQRGRCHESSSDGGGTRGVALIRPPGHHAETNRAMGFCFFNNIAIAAEHAIARHKLGRVLIVDWDVHHGNGTQEIFCNRRDVLVFNVHEAGQWPGTGAPDERGESNGLGYTVNCPLPSGSGDADYLALFRRVLAPIAREYQPQLVLVSAGFDAHARDPLGGMNLTESGFAAMCAIVQRIADECAQSRLGLILEGGYDLEGLSESVAACIRIMAGETPPAIEGVASPAVKHIIDRAIAIHRDLWPALNPEP